jgi:hypothetical protein
VYTHTRCITFIQDSWKRRSVFVCATLTFELLRAGSVEAIVNRIETSRESVAFTRDIYEGEKGGEGGRRKEGRYGGREEGRK